MSPRAWTLADLGWGTRNTGSLDRDRQLGRAVVAQIAFTYAPPLQGVFGRAALAPAELAVALALGPQLLVAVEIGKWAVAKGAGGAHA